MRKNSFRSRRWILSRRTWEFKLTIMNGQNYLRVNVYFIWKIESLTGESSKRATARETSDWLFLYSAKTRVKFSLFKFTEIFSKPKRKWKNRNRLKSTIMNLNWTRKNVCSDIFYDRYIEVTFRSSCVSDKTIQLSLHDSWVVWNLELEDFANRFFPWIIKYYSEKRYTLNFLV